MKRILIADDDPTTRSMMSLILQRQGYEVIAVEGGEQAWEHFQRPDPPRLAVLDWLMPGMDGLELCRRIRAARHERYIYLMLLTSKNRREDIIAGFDAGADDYLVKPIDIGQLHARLRAAQRILDLQEELHSTGERLKRSNDEMELINRLAPSALFTVNPEREVVTWNRRCEEITGLAVEDVLGRECPFYRRVCGTSCGLCQAEFPDAIVSRELLFPHPHGGARLLVKKTALLRDEHGELLGSTESFEDLTEEKRREERIHFLSFYDPLTGLPNRTLLQERLKKAIAAARGDGRQVALLFIDLDRFKNVNDTLGHCSGDHLLRKAAERLSQCLRMEDSFGRTGGDEYVVILADLEAPSEAAHAAQKVGEALAAPFQIEGRDITLSASIGISIYPQNGETFETLVKHAGLAMNQAKEGGRNGFQFFTPEMNERATEALTLEIYLRRALERGEFSLVFQPQVRIGTEEIIATEALLRWHSPELGTVSPERFICVAEERGLILPIGEWVLRSACLQNRQWQVAGLHPIPVAVNVSAVEFRQHDFAEKVARILQETGMDARYLELEVTESVVMLGAEEVAERLCRLKEMGVALSIDDFGTGYSSLSYLRRFPFDKVKVDRSFIRDLETCQDAVAITQAILGLAKTLKLKTIAEGVETERQLCFLREQGCDEIQGYHFSEPLPPEEFAALLRERPRLRAGVG